MLTRRQASHGVDATFQSIDYSLARPENTCRMCAKRATALTDRGESTRFESVARINVANRIDRFSFMATGLVIHISSGTDKHTQVLTDEHVRIGTGNDCGVRLRSSSLPKRADEED